LTQERLDSIEAVQELHNLKIEQVETLFTGLKGKVERLEIKDKEILEDLGKLDKKSADVGSSVSTLSLSSSKITTEQRLQSNNYLNKTNDVSNIFCKLIRFNLVGFSSNLAEMKSLSMRYVIQQLDLPAVRIFV